MGEEESIGFEILRAIRRIIRQTSQQSRSLSRQGGLSLPQMLSLKAISEFPSSTEVTVAMVAETVQLSAPTVSRILDRLEKSGFITRRRDSSDRRKVCIALTEEGMKRVRMLPTSLHEQLLGRLELLDRDEQVALLKALERVVELMGAEGMDASPLLTPELEIGPDANEDASQRSR